MINRFSNYSDSDSVYNQYDYVIYKVHEEILYKIYYENKGKVL